MAASPEAREHAVARAGRIFSALKQYALAHQPCPSNKLLAERFGCGTARIVDALHFLESAGMIEVEQVSGGRIVTICATGAKTAPAIRWKEPARGRKAA